ncbi:hypothetical protein A9Q86_16075 [Flavobacteriales bacterium 33_180_T64]|nr:hypothetical protein A9Q86_16075 [Flavobacteriales bacterium 33_180_T64]
MISNLNAQQTMDLSKMKSSFEKRRPTLDVMSTNPSDYNLKYEAFNVTTLDNINISSWFIPNPLKQGTVLMVHGFDMNKSHMLKRASVFYQKGYSVLLLDLRARGESGGDKASTGKKNGLEIAAVYDYYKTNLKNYGAVTLYGFSHGGRAVIFGASKIGSIKKMILESPPYQLGESFKRQYRMPNAPKISEIPINNALASIPNTTILLLIGDTDTAIIESEAETLIKTSANNHSRMVLFNNTAHNVFSKQNMFKYQTIVFNFITNN